MNIPPFPTCIYTECQKKLLDFFSISNINVFLLKFHMSNTCLLEYTVHSCQVDLKSNSSTGRRYAVFTRHSRASVC